MRVLFLTIGDEAVASSRSRVFQYFPHLAERGVEARVAVYRYGAVYRYRRDNVPLVPEHIGQILRVAKLYFLAPAFDVLVVQKVLLPIPFQRMLKALNANLMFDFDDAIYTPFPGITQKAELGSVISLPAEFTHMLSISKCVVLENDFNAEIARPFCDNILMITGPIDTDRYRPAMWVRGEKVTIGWIGAPWTAVCLNLVHNVFRSLYTRYPGTRFLFVGAGDLSFEGVPIIVKSWSLETEVRDLQQFDIGVMPLPDDVWSRGKGGYKLLQYMAMGIPCVASPVGINKVLIQDWVNGFLADKEDEWIEKMSILIENQELRRQMGAAGRDIAERLYSFQAATPRLVAALEAVSRTG